MPILKMQFCLSPSVCYPVYACFSLKKYQELLLLRKINMAKNFMLNFFMRGNFPFYRKY